MRGASGRRGAALALLLAAACAAVDAPPPLARCEGRRALMGTDFRIVAYAPDEAAGARAIEAAFARVEALNALLSDYDAASELSRLSARAGQGPIEVSEELWGVLSAAQEFAQATGGAFDVTVGPYVRLWRRSSRQGELPSRERLAEAARSVGHEQLRLVAPRTVELLAPDMRLDLGGIAKGYALDECLRVLRERGVASALVDGGGDVAVSAPPPGEEAWIVALEHPTAGAGPPLALALAHAAVATSGDTQRFVEIEGRRYSHLVDPRTGLGLTRRVGASVVAPDGMTADALASAACVLEPAAALERLERMPGVEGRVVLAEPARTLATSGFEALRAPPPVLDSAAPPLQEPPR